MQRININCFHSCDFLSPERVPTTAAMWVRIFSLFLFFFFLYQLKRYVDRSSRRSPSSSFESEWKKKFLKPEKNHSSFMNGRPDRIARVVPAEPQGENRSGRENNIYNVYIIYIYVCILLTLFGFSISISIKRTRVVI